MIDSMMILDAILGLCLVMVALGTLLSQDLFQASVMFVFFGLIMAIAWCRLDAIDVALAEAAIGSGLTGALLLNTLAAIRRQRGVSADRGSFHTDWRAVLTTKQGLQRTGVLITTSTLVAAIGLAAVVMPLANDSGEVVIQQGSNTGVSELSTRRLGIASADTLPPSGVIHPVTAVLLNFRAYDTLLEVAVLLAAVFAVLPVTQFATGYEQRPPLGPFLAMFIRLIAPLATLVATYILWIGTKAPGGAFQASAILAAVAVLLILAGASPPSFAHRRWRLLLIFGSVVFLIVAVEGMFAERKFFQYRDAWAGVTITGVEVALTISIALVLTMLFSCTLPTAEESS